MPRSFLAFLALTCQCEGIKDHFSKEPHCKSRDWFRLLQSISPSAHGLPSSAPSPRGRGGDRDASGGVRYARSEAFCIKLCDQFMKLFEFDPFWNRFFLHTFCFGQCCRSSQAMTSKLGFMIEKEKLQMINVKYVIFHHMLTMILHTTYNFMKFTKILFFSVSKLQGLILYSLLFLLCSFMGVVLMFCTFLGISDWTFDQNLSEERLSRVFRPRLLITSLRLCPTSFILLSPVATLPVSVIHISALMVFVWWIDGMCNKWL